MQQTGIVENNGRFYQREESSVEVQDGGEIRGNAVAVFQEEDGDWKTQSED